MHGDSAKRRFCEPEGNQYSRDVERQPCYFAPGGRREGCAGPQPRPNGAATRLDGAATMAARTCGSGSTLAFVWVVHEGNCWQG